MDFDHENVRRMINFDRFSSLPDELIHQILLFVDTKTAVQTCSLSSRWRFLWKSTSSLNFSSGNFNSLPKFSKFITHVLLNRSQEVGLTSLNLTFRGAACESFVKIIADYAFAENVSELNFVIFPKRHHSFSPSLFSSKSLQHFTLKSLSLTANLLPKTAWNFPVLTTLHLEEVIFRDDITGHESLDLFSKCVNLKNLKLHLFHGQFLSVFDIIAPKLENLTLTNSKFKLINLVTPKLENLTVTNCSIQKLNAPSGLPSLNKASIYLSIYRYRKPYKDEVAHKTIYLLHEVRSARFLTLNADVIECISSFPDVISRHPPPYKNLICIKIDTRMRKGAHKIKVSTEARNFFLENSPSATFIMEIPEAPPSRSIKLKEAWERKNAKQVADFESHLTKLQASIEVASYGIKERIKAEYDNLMAELAALNKKVKEYAEMQSLDGRRKGKVERQARARIEAFARKMRDLVDQENDELLTIVSKKDLTRSLLEKFPKQQRAEIEAHYSRQIQESESQLVQLSNEHLTSKGIVDNYVEFMSSNIVLLIFTDVSSSNIPLASQPSSSSLATIPTPSTSNIDCMP